MFDTASLPAMPLEGFPPHCLSSWAPTRCHVAGVPGSLTSLFASLILVCCSASKFHIHATFAARVENIFPSTGISRGHTTVFVLEGRFDGCLGGERMSFLPVCPGTHPKASKRVERDRDGRRGRDASASWREAVGQELKAQERAQ